MPTNVSISRADADQDPFKKMPKAKKSAGKPKEAPAILLGEHSRYQIKSGWLAGTFVARAFPKPPTTARGMIAEATGATEEVYRPRFLRHPFASMRPRTDGPSDRV